MQQEFFLCPYIGIFNLSRKIRLLDNKSSEILLDMIVAGNIKITNIFRY